MLPDRVSNPANLASQGGFSVLVLGDFRRGALLFMVIHVIYKYKNRLK